MRHKSISFNFALTSLTFLVALITGCSSGSKSAPVTTTPAATFSVASSSPATGATSVSTTAAILVTFSGPATATTVNATNIALTNGKNSAVAGAVTYNATTYVATLTPTAALTAGTTYTLTVSNVTSSSGTAMTSAITTTFTTAAATAPPPTAQYQGTLFPEQASGGSGQVSVNTAGLVTIQLTGAPATTTYAAQFCPSYLIYTAKPYACIALGNVASTASGSATATTQFPQAGSWAGEFQLVSGTTTEYETGLVPTSDANGVTQVYMAALQSDTTVNGKGDGATGTQGPLTSGSVTYTSSTQSLLFTLTGASPDTIYTSGEDGVLGGSSSYLLYTSSNQSAFTTDSSGDVTFTVLQDGTAGDIFTVDTNNVNSGAGYVAGFTVPAS